MELSSARIGECSAPSNSVLMRMISSASLDGCGSSEVTRPLTPLAAG